MNGRFQMQGGKNWFLPKEMNANRFFCDSHWLEIWSNHFYPSMGPNGGSVAMDSVVYNTACTVYTSYCTVSCRCTDFRFFFIIFILSNKIYRCIYYYMKLQICPQHFNIFDFLASCSPACIILQRPLSCRRCSLPV